MASPDSALDPQAMAEARALLGGPPPEPMTIWPTLGAAALAAVCALTLATTMVMAPPVTTTPAERTAR